MKRQRGRSIRPTFRIRSGKILSVKILGSRNRFLSET